MFPEKESLIRAVEGDGRITLPSMRNTFTDPAHVLVDRGDTTQIILQVSLILPQGHVMVIEIFWGILLEIDVRQVVGNPSWSPYAQ